MNATSSPALRDYKTINDGNSLVASAPCRIDCGGTWDLRAFCLPFHQVRPTTVNIAIGLRTHVRLSSFRTGWTRVTSREFLVEEYPGSEAPFDTPLGLIFAISNYFGVTGVEINVDSESPPRSALGGSGALGVAVVTAFSKLYETIGSAKLSRDAVIELAFSIEDGVSVSLTGRQDQAAASYGGVNQWIWGKDGKYERIELLKREQASAVEPRLLIAYCGVTHDSVDVNGAWVSGFLGGRNRSLWFEMNQITANFGAAISKQDWTSAAKLLRAETELRQTVTPEVLVPTTQALFDAAVARDCGARFTGAGGGGCMWAIGELDSIASLREAWSSILASAKGARLLPARVDFEGAR